MEQAKKSWTLYLLSGRPNPTHWKCANGSWCAPWTAATEHIAWQRRKTPFWFFYLHSFFTLHISLFASFTVELIPWMFRHDSILNIVVYRITMLYELKHSRRETTHCFSHIMHIHTNTSKCTTRTHSFACKFRSLVGWLEYNFRISRDLKFESISRVRWTLFKIYVSLTHTVNYSIICALICCWLFGISMQFVDSLWSCRDSI